MPGRSYTGNGYRYGFHGKEKDDEVKNASGTQYDYGFRIYDPRLGKFLSIDPLQKKFPFYSPYHFAGNFPIANVDLDGREPLGFMIPLTNAWTIASGGKQVTGAKNIAKNAVKTAGVLWDLAASDVSDWWEGKKAAYRSFGEGLSDLANPKQSSGNDYMPDPIQKVAELQQKLEPYGKMATGFNEAASDALFIATVFLPLVGETAMAAATTEETVSIFRAVSTNELADISASKGFNLPKGGNEVKYFSKNLDDAVSEGQQLYPNGDFHIVETKLPRSAFDKLDQMELDNAITKDKSIVADQKQLDLINTNRGKINEVKYNKKN